MMKNWIVGFCLLALAAHSEEEFRIFTVTDGRPIEARIVSYDASRQRVVVQRNNNRRIPVKLSVFSEEDREYVLDWYAAHQFGKASKFKLSLKQELVRKWKEEAEAAAGRGGGGRGGRGGGGGQQNTATETPTQSNSEYRFDLLIENLTGLKLEDLEIEYRIYSTRKREGGGAAGGGRGGGRNRGDDTDQETQETGDSTTEEVIVGGKTTLKLIEDKAKETVSSDLVVISDLEGGRRTIDSEMEGAWFKVRMKGPDGEIHERNISFPSGFSEKKVWKDATPERAPREDRRQERQPEL